MFEIGEYVIHNASGLCIVKDIITYMDKKYYVLNKYNDDRTRIMVPVNSNLNLLRKVITKDEIDNIIEEIPNIEVNPIYDYRKRTLEYDKMLKSGDTKTLFKLIKTMYKQRDVDNKVLTENDKKIINAAKELIDTEFAYILNIEQNEVENYILDKYDHKKQYKL